MAAKGQHFLESAFQYRDNICALTFRICFIVGKAEAYRFVDFAPVCGNTEVTVTANRKA
jgi:hypothetical protein